MGIPRFYRYISERYPLINQPISDVSLLPEFDAFYLDMNGIIHNCTHTDAADSELNRLGLPAQLHNIFTYMDRLITHIIKPKQLVYIAIDGVAPRAKLNQQRSRRFRAGMEREEALAKEKHRQIKLEDEKNGHSATPPPQRFDSNCITPGTQFLTELSAHLVWFVRYKMKTDPLWSRLEVFFSGSEVPGEGEHKIVDFIRRRKMAPGYSPNVRHCMYGSDADLMLLGLMTHEPHFTLVREVVVWGSKTHKVTAKKIEEEQWQLVHLSLFREYLMMEMRVVAPLDGERMLDDFILLTYLLGNDFIPHSPTLEISEDAIPLLMRVYREHLDKHGGQYLTENGQLININLLQDLFETIGAMEEDILIDRAIEEAKRHGKHKRAYNERRTGPSVEVNEDEVANAINLLNDGDDDDLPPPLIDDEEEDDDIGVSDEEAKERELLEALDGELEAKLALEKEEEDREIYSQLTGTESFQDTKWTYYERKFGIQRGNGSANNAELERVKKHYLEAIVWCLHYYFQGPPSWSWYYPYHYAPMVSDLTNIADVVKDIKFGNDPATDGPLLPFEQLMANLPSTSAHLVPEPYRFLMMSPLSPIKHFYPEKFEIDMEGKRNPWEGVNLLPFIDVALLKSAIAQYCPENRLTKAERQRNRLQLLPLRISYDPQAYETVPSTMPGYPGFPDIAACCTRVSEYSLPDITSYEGQFQSRLMDGVTLPMAGFPSLYTVPLESVRVEHIRVNCFGMGSRKATLILQLPPTGRLEEAVNPQELLGKTALVNWPNLHEALVVGISTLAGEFRQNRNSTDVAFTPFDNDKKVEWAQYAQSEVYRLLCGRGTPGSGGLDLGQTGIACVLHVLPLQGMISNPVTGAIEKKFGQTEALVPLQLAVVDRKLHDERFEETGPMAMEERFPVDSVALITKGKWLGCTAVIQKCDSSRNKVTVRVNTIDKEPPFGYVVAQQISDKYYPGYMVAQKLGISTTTLGLLTGSVVIKPTGQEIGLNVRFRKDLLLPGYCRLVNKAASSPGGAGDENNVWRKGDVVKIVGSGVSLEREEQQAKRANGNGSGGGTTWEYTDRTIAVLAAYKAEFPEVFINLDKLSFATQYGGKEIFGTSDKKIIQDKADAVVAWIEQQQLGKKEHSKHIPINSQYISLNAMRAIEAAGALRAKEREKSAAQQVSNPIVVDVAPAELFRPNPLVNQDLTGSVVAEQATKNPGAPRLGDRVINISARGVPFGQRGTVVATHVTSKCVEVLFDEGFTGGEPLYGSISLNRGKIVPWTNVICVSTPPGEENKTQSRDQRGQQQTSRRQSNSRQTQQQPQPLQPGSIKITSNYRQPRKGKTMETEPPAEVESADPPVQTSAPAPAPPDPEKIKMLMAKWTQKGSVEYQAQSTEVEVTAPEVAGDEVVPSVAALFSAAAQAAAPPPSESANLLATLFPHLAEGKSNIEAPETPAAPVNESANLLASLFPHMAEGNSSSVAPPLPPHPASFLPHGIPGQPPMPPMPPQAFPPFMHPHQLPLPPSGYPPYPPYPLPPQQDQHKPRENRRGSKEKAPAPVASLTEYPPLGAAPPTVQPKKEDTTTDEPATSSEDKKKRTPRNKPRNKSVNGEKTWVPKDASSTDAAAPAPAANKPSLLLPSQVMRQQKPSTSSS